MRKKKKAKIIKNLVGKPSKIGTIDFKQFKQLALVGFTDKQLADFFSIDKSTLTRWKQKYSKLRTSLKNWKKEADAKVEKSLYQRAIGYQYDEVTYEKSKTGGLEIRLEQDEIDCIKHTDTNKTKVIVKEVIPDVTAQIFWLKNRQPDQWRDKTEVSRTPEENITQEKIGKQLSRIAEVLAKRTVG